MAYHIFVHDDSSREDSLLDLYLGSAATISLYWERIGRTLGLPIISTLSERADSEEGLILCGADLVSFNNEMLIFEKYWINGDSNVELPKEFLGNVRRIIEQTEQAIGRGMTLMVA